MRPSWPRGWRVVLDVVYNHTFAAGPSSRHSVLDKLVPGYYHRRMEDGEMCHSTCCQQCGWLTMVFGVQTATEHYMAERLVVEDIVHWARHYKIDGFRFDIMGHLMVSTLAKMRAGLDALTPERDGVDGKSIYIYGEAWDFGEVVNNARGINCGQMNLAGTKLGAFNDRLRDGALGGGPFQPHDFQAGCTLAPSSCRGQGGPEAQLQELLQLSDWLRYSLAGNLRAFPLETSSGQVLRGEDAKAHGLPLAYGAEPCEHIAFIGCHDNLTMFDTITEKAPLTAFAEERMRMQVMCLALILLSQGIPFIHAGDDLLRSKSLDRDSYNSGDYFNAVDWTGSTHKLGIGLPVHTKNGGGWHYKRPLLTNPLIKPSAAHIQTSAAITQQLLRIRYSSPLFRLPTQAAVLDQVSFTNTGPDQVPGVIVMQLESALGTDMTGSVYDPNFERLVVVFNAAPLSQVHGSISHSNDSNNSRRMGLYSKSHPYRRKGCHAARCACCATCTQASSTGWVEIHVEGEAASYRSGQSLLAIGQVTAQMAEIIKACDNLVPAVTPLAHRTCAQAAAAALAVGKRLQGQEQPMPGLCSTPTQAAAQPGPAHSPCPHHLPDQPPSHPSQLQGSSQHHIIPALATTSALIAAPAPALTPAPRAALAPAPAPGLCMRPSITKPFVAMPMFDQKRDDKHWDDECLTLLCSFAPDSVMQLCTLGKKLSVKMLNEYCKAVGLCVPANTLRADLRYMVLQHLNEQAECD
ncbi:hypothetical protein QJQ45_012002 [Haematococcus lacustris]|nr:hypothetical protein QJQ45_012002 [Haematococcus lacustris]